MGNLIVAIIGALSVLVVQVEPGTEEIRRVMQECLIQTNIRSQEEIEFIRTRTMPTTQQGMCFLGCLMEGYGYLIDGEFTEESCEAFAIQQGQTRETAAALFNLCHSKVGDGDDRCETGPRLWKCFADAHTNN